MMGHDGIPIPRGQGVFRILFAAVSYTPDTVPSNLIQALYRAWKSM